MTDNLLTLAGAVVIVLAAIAACAALAVTAVRTMRPRRDTAADDALATLARLQADTAVRVDAMREMLAGRQAELHRAVNERLDSVTHRVGQSMEATTRHTMDSLRMLHERLGLSLIHI